MQHLSPTVSLPACRPMSVRNQTISSSAGPASISCAGETFGRLERVRFAGLRVDRIPEISKRWRLQPGRGDRPDNRRRIFRQPFHCIERNNGTSLAYIKKGRRSAERLLMVNSSCYDAYLALG